MRHFLYSVLLFVATIPVFVYAQEQKVYSPLILVKNAGSEITNFSDYIGFLYGMSISLAALLAVIKIIIAGTKYMVSDIVSNKGDAISDIQGAILGLLLILGAVIILEFINPQLVKRDIKFDSIGPRPALNTSVKTASGLSSTQLAEVLTSGLNPCLAKYDNTTGSDKTIIVVGVSVANCTAADKPAEILTEVRNRCKAQGGYIYNSPDRTAVGCAVQGVFVEKFSINDYKTTSNSCWIPSIPILNTGGALCTDVKLNSAYSKQTGRLITYDAVAFCKKEYPQLSQSTCLEDTKDAFMENDDKNISGKLQDTYCTNNGGRSRGPFSCELPSKTLNSAEAKEMFLLKNPNETLMSKSAYSEICKEKFGNSASLVDLERTWSEDDILCVVY